jgi:hypothetical protein
MVGAAGLQPVVRVPDTATMTIASFASTKNSPPTRIKFALIGLGFLEGDILQRFRHDPLGYSFSSSSFGTTGQCR